MPAVSNQEALKADSQNQFGAERWNACLRLLCRPLDELTPTQKRAALVLHYHGRVMNGGHLSHFDGPETSRDDQLLEALKIMGATEHARLLGEAIFLRNEARRAEEDDAEGGNRGDYAWELVEDLDRRFYHLKPEILEFLAKYFDAHPESFPK